MALASLLSLTLAAFACNSREKVEVESASSAISAPLDIPLVAANELLKGLEATHARVQVTPQAANEQRYPTLELVLPKAWVAVQPVAGSLFASSAFATFSDRDAQRPALVAVAFTPAPFEVPIDAYLKQALANEGWTFLKGASYPGPFGAFYEATATRNVGNTLVVRRTSVRLHQGTIVMVSAACPRERWDQLKRDLWLAHVSAELLGTKPDETSEKRVRVASLPMKGSAQPPSFETVYPASWTAEPAQSSDKDIAGIHFRLLDSADVLEAYIVARAVRHEAGVKPSVSELVARSKRMLGSSGATLTSEPAAIPDQDDLLAQAVPGWLGGFTASGHLGDSEIDVRMGFVQKQTLTFGMLMLSPKLKNNELVALRAQRAFEIIRAGLTTREL